MSATHEIRVRYADCDMQGVVYNAHYLTFVDDALDTWLRGLHPHFEKLGWELMLKTASLTWHRPARLGDRIAVRAEVVRWGTTSFEVAFGGSVAGEACFDAAVTYVVVDASTYRPIPVPDDLRTHLS